MLRGVRMALGNLCFYTSILGGCFKNRREIVNTLVENIFLFYRFILLLKTVLKDLHNITIFLMG